MGMTKYGPNKITATMKLVVTGEFYDDEASEETLRYCIEQDLEDAGFEVDVSLLKEQERPKSVKEPLLCNNSPRAYKGICPWCNSVITLIHGKFCDKCGKAVKWDD